MPSRVTRFSRGIGISTEPSSVSRASLQLSKADLWTFCFPNLGNHLFGQVWATIFQSWPQKIPVGDHLVFVGSLEQLSLVARGLGEEAAKLLATCTAETSLLSAGVPGTAPRHGVPCCCFGFVVGALSLFGPYEAERNSFRTEMQVLPLLGQDQQHWYITDKKQADIGPHLFSTKLLTYKHLCS